MLFLLLLNTALVLGEYTRDLEVSEGVAVGTRIGFIEDGSSGENGPPYLIIPVQDTSFDNVFDIDQKTGEIKTKMILDRESKTSYYFVAVPLNGQNIQVIIHVIDENDNSPVFSNDVMNIEFPENTPRDVKRTLNPAIDADAGIYSTQKYNIISGNVNNAFRLSYHREKDDVLYLDLQINGVLDRETIPSYSLKIEALDGGIPPLKGNMTVNITIQDVNDNPPIFNQTRYFGLVPENATIGTGILKIYATDVDDGENGEVEYAINRRQSDKDLLFDVDPITGLISVNKPLDFESRELHELVVVAKDRGSQPLETTAFVSINVTDVNDNRPTINLIFISDDATPKISEAAEPGDFVARISVNDPDSKNEYSNVNVTLEGGEGHFGLTTQDSFVYLVIVSNPIDRELKPNYTLTVVATDTGSPPLHAFKTFDLLVTDVNDNAPQFEQDQYKANVLEIAEPGTSVIKVSATDRDEGENSELNYSILNDGDTNWFEIDSKTGVITTKYHVDCETDPMPKLVVVATDNGHPPLSSTVPVLVTIHDFNDNDPIFSQTFYNVTIPEDKPKGSCILKVFAADSDCGVNSMINYTLPDAPIIPFYVKSTSGDICVTSELDYEEKKVYEFLVIATDRGGLSSSSLVKVSLTDVNDNRPVFLPKEYTINIRDEIPGNSAVGIVKATDSDSGRYGAVSYRIVSGNDDNSFRVDRNTGDIFLVRANALSRSEYSFNVSATDGAGEKCLQDAQVVIRMANTIQFERSRYVFNVTEDAPVHTHLGSLKANVLANGDEQIIRYFIGGGDSNGWFVLDEFSGLLKTAAIMDYDKAHSVLLNVYAVYGIGSSTSYTQVFVHLEKRNDAPRFDATAFRLSVPENAPLGALFAVYAHDTDTVRYRIGSDVNVFAIEAGTGVVSLVAPLDYETNHRYAVIVSASDSELSANVTVFVEVQDVNDNAPFFEQAEYTITVAESLPLYSQIVQVTAVDADTGNNAKISYKLSTSEMDNDFGTEYFGVYPNNGWVYTKKLLDRETHDSFILKVTANDNGMPRNTATAAIHITISDCNDNDPAFSQEYYEFSVEENKPRGTVFGSVKASDRDLDTNAVIRYSLIPANSSFQINAFSGDLSTREPLDREIKSSYELVAEAKDQGSPPRSSRVTVKVIITDVNDNAPVLDDPQEDVVSVREEQAPGTEVVRVRATDPDEGYNATLSYSIVKGRDTEGYGLFTIDPLSGIMRTRTVLDHDERSMYRIAVAATDNGIPPKQTVRILRVEVLDVNDNRPTFTSSSLLFKVREDVPVGYMIGNVINAEPSSQANRGHIMYTLTYISPFESDRSFEIDRRSGSLIVIRPLDRETIAEYRLEVRALDTSTNPQSNAVVVKIEITDVNDNAPKWKSDPTTISVQEDAVVGASVWNFSATDSDLGPNQELKYSLVSQSPSLQSTVFSVDMLTGNLIVMAALDYETVKVFTLVIKATDQAVNSSQRLSTAMTVQVMIQDTNDNSPQIIAPVSHNFHVGNTLKKGSYIGRVIAVDQDSGENGRVAYELTGGNDLGLFGINRDTGELTVTKNVNRISDESYLLNITVSDHGSPISMKSTTTVNVTSQATSDYQLKFGEGFYKVNISEDTSTGTVVFSAASHVVDYSPGGSSNRLRYDISSGSGENTFVINEKDGTITLRRPLDRESRDQYVIQLYLKDPKNKKFDSTVLIVNVLDVNDNAPYFEPDSCYPLYIPENMESSVVHTVVAVDYDLGNNGKIVYSISGGNVGNKFHIDQNTGELTAHLLDREVRSEYGLIISAQDQSFTGSLISYCNITVFVEDENDNDPQFEKQMYSVNIPESVPIGSAVLTVKAIDLDLNLNAMIIYSFRNESDWLFRIDNQTGLITTNGVLDRERRNFYSLQVTATDRSRYKFQPQLVSVEITIDDVNDNKPVFDKYPYSVSISPYAHVGSELVKVLATDADTGSNGEVTYRIANDYQLGKFRINSNTGSITVGSSLTSLTGKTVYIEAIATDRGNPPLSASCLIEIRISDSQDGLMLRFQDARYTANISENTPVGENILQVFAFKSDGRRQKITYSFGNGNENEPFEINAQTGQIKVRNSSLLDYETKSEFRLSLVAQTENSGGSPLFAFSELTIHLFDRNDNPPMFTQEQYFTSVYEGISKGTFVIQLLAIDADFELNSMVSYHIVDGNHDNAFIIKSPTSNVIRTNIVLDAEIRNSYKLTVIATDEGTPQLTGTATVLINVIDINDNQPSFPPNNAISVLENEPVGKVLTTISANDVDSYPTLVYTINTNFENDSSAIFAIDRYSGRLILKKPLDYEKKNFYQLEIIATDSKFSAQTVLSITVLDENDNAPVFSQPYYQFVLSDASTTFDGRMYKVNATDQDSNDNGIIDYAVVSQTNGIFIDKHSGIISFNYSLISKDLLNKGFFDVLVRAKDNGSPSLSTSVVVKFDTRYGFHTNLLQTSQTEYRISIRENTPKGRIVTRLNLSSSYDLKMQYSITSGNEDSHFDILSPSGDLILMKRLDRETKDVYSLQVITGLNSTPVYVHVVVEDSNDNFPQFTNFNRNLVVPETTPINSTLLNVHATDLDLPPNSDVVYRITSGNDNGLFDIDPIGGALIVKKTLDSDRDEFEIRLVVAATDVAKYPDLPLCSLTRIRVSVTDENDNEPRFPIAEYLEFVAENEPVGTTIFIAKATDMDRGVYGKVNYTIVSDGDDSWKLFKINANTGLLTTGMIFDYEARSRYAITVSACDVGMKCAKAKVRIEIESKDEFYPQFTERTFKFGLSGDATTGHIVGHVTATDRDKGPDGRVVYQLSTQNPYFKLNRTTGAIILKKKLDSVSLDQDISLVVTASSGRQGSLTNMSVVEIVLDPLSSPGVNLASSGSSSGISWIVGFLVLILILAAGSGGALFLHFRNQRRRRKVNKPNLNVTARVDYVDPGAFDTIPIRGTVAHTVSQFGPPKYDEIPTYRGNSGTNSAAATTSELSGSEQSGSSGRGSAEDGEDVDEEIRMINEGQNRVLRNPDDDNMSDVSVHNTQEYLARLGIIDSQGNSSTMAGFNDMVHRQQHPVDQLAMFDDETNNEAEINNIIYAKLNDVASERGSSGVTEVDRSSTGRTTSVDRNMVLDGYQAVHSGTQPSMSGSLSSIVHSEEELTGSYNWDYLLDWGPQYQPLAHVFSEIARLKDDAASVKSGTSGTSSNKSKQHPMKNVPPPLLTSVAPRSAPVISSRQGHSTQSQMLLMPRSPISHDIGFSTSAAMSPSFSPSLSPLATRSPSGSPLHLHTMSSNPHLRHRHNADSDIRM